MTRAELEQVRQLLQSSVDCCACLNAHGIAEHQRMIDRIDAELAKPEAREWGVQFNDGREGLDDRVYGFIDEIYCRWLVAQDPRRKLFSRSAESRIPAGPWEVAE